MQLDDLIAEIERLGRSMTSDSPPFEFVASARTLLPLCGKLLKVLARHTPDCKCYAKDDIAELAEILEAKND